MENPSSAMLKFNFSAFDIDNFEMQWMDLKNCRALYLMVWYKFGKFTKTSI